MSGVFSTRIQNKNFNYNNLILKLIDSCLQANEILIFIDFLPDEGHPRNVPDEGYPRDCCLQANELLIFIDFERT